MTNRSGWKGSLDCFEPPDRTSLHSSFFSVALPHAVKLKWACVEKCLCQDQTALCPHKGQGYCLKK